MIIDKKHEQQIAQSLLKEYAGFLQHISDELNKDYDSPINADTAEKVQRMQSNYLFKG
jgi:hypothetical protein